MSQDLTNSSTQRQNILNNPFALQEIEKATHIQGIPFEGRSVVLKEEVAGKIVGIFTGQSRQFIIGKTLR